MKMLRSKDPNVESCETPDVIFLHIVKQVGLTSLFIVC